MVLDTLEESFENGSYNILNMIFSSFQWAFIWLKTPNSLWDIEFLS